MAIKIWVGTDTGNEGDLDTGANWSPSGKPAAGDDVYFTDSSQAVSSGSLDVGTTGLASCHFEQSFTGAVGTESSFIRIDTQRIEIGAWSGVGARPAGSGRINIDLGGDVDCQAVVHDSADPSTDDNRTPIRLLANSASTDLFVRGGNVSLADDPSDTTTVGDITVIEDAESGATSPELLVSETTTYTSIDVYSGTVYLDGGTTGTLNTYDGTVRLRGTENVSTHNNYGATVIDNRAATTTTYNHYAGDIDFTKSGEARTYTNFVIKEGAIGSILGLLRSYITLTNGVTKTSGRDAQVTIS